MACTGIEHQAEGSSSIDHHRRPNAANLVPPCWRYVARFTRFDHDLGQLVDRISDGGRGRRYFRSSSAGPNRPTSHGAGQKRRPKPMHSNRGSRKKSPYCFFQVPASTLQRRYIVVDRLPGETSRNPETSSIALRFLRTKILASYVKSLSRHIAYRPARRSMAAGTAFGTGYFPAVARSAPTSSGGIRPNFPS